MIELLDVRTLKKQNLLPSLNHHKHSEISTPQGSNSDFLQAHNRGSSAENLLKIMRHSKNKKVLDPIEKQSVNLSPSKHGKTLSQH